MVSNRLKPTVAVNKKTWGEKVDKQAKNQLVPDSSQICPKSHPIIAHDGKSLVLCRDCAQGVCAKFRTSNVEVCCQNSDDICGAGSQVLMDSLVPRDCSRKQCGKGTGEICNPAFPICSQGADCELNKSQDAHICCRKYRSKLSDRKTLVAPPPPFFYSSTTPLPFIMTTTTKMDTVIAATQEPVVTV
uniref:Uncharacterized protein n=1 Tax=Caenorhabditis japonica TaxID=281687 RepID=A0A8R1HQ60_CAEJA